jgi:hypothetical protein
MPIRLPIKPLIVAFAIEVALLAAGFPLYAWVGSSLQSGSLSSSAGFQLMIGMLILVLFVPAFVAGYLGRRLGFLYGIVLGLLPTVLGGFSTGGDPIVMLGFYLLLAGLSGVAGQSFSNWRHAP